MGTAAFTGQGYLYKLQFWGFKNVFRLHFFQSIASQNSHLKLILVMVIHRRMLLGVHVRAYTSLCDLWCAVYTFNADIHVHGSTVHLRQYRHIEGLSALPNLTTDAPIQVCGHTLLVSGYLDNRLDRDPNLERVLPIFIRRGESTLCWKEAVLFGAHPSFVYVGIAQWALFDTWNADSSRPLCRYTGVYSSRGAWHAFDMNLKRCFSPFLLRQHFSIPAIQSLIGLITYCDERLWLLSIFYHLVSLKLSTLWHARRLGAEYK